MNPDPKPQPKKQPILPGRHELPFFCLILGLFGIGILLSPTLWAMVVALLIWGLLLRRHPLGWIKSAVALILIYFVILESAVFLFMIKDRVRPDPVEGTETLVIPGAGLVGLEPDLYLKLRLDRAAALLEQYPQMTAVVSGWQAQDELAAEASVMKSYLVRRGIAQHRIFEEPQGYDTIRNFEYAGETIQTHGLSRDIVIVTNDFHSFRSAAIARTMGFRPLSAPVPSPGPLLLKYLVRETASLIKIQLHFGFSLQ